MTTAYKERDDWVPNPLFVSGYIDTTGTGGEAPGQMDAISPIFADARAAALAAEGIVVEEPVTVEEEAAVAEPEAPGDEADATVESVDAEATAEPASEAPAADAAPKSVEDMTVPELVAHAQSQGVDLTGVSRKEDIKAAIVKAQEPQPEA